MSFIYLDYSTGKKFDFLNPDSTPLTMEQIARGLSREFRWSNQSPLMITVAEHSLFCSYFASIPQDHELGILLHDASECVMRDIPAPLKALLPDYREIEKRVQNSIWKSFGIQPPPQDLIETVDARALDAEIWGTRPPMNYDFKPLTIDVAERSFLNRFKDLWDRKQKKGY
jgi:hypothetical protein